ncbi:MAG: GGDEF domain-containing protein [Oscillospiraceae bacterium]|nr:GGDEF domain-containing protein [Oscillospiraceae bacterium]
MDGEIRKKIGVITTDPENIYQVKVLEGITGKAAQMNYDVLVFATFVKANHLNLQYLEGESNIFNIINFEKLDGVILLTQSFRYHSDNLLYDKIYGLLKKKCRCPVITVDESIGSYEKVVTDDIESFQKLTNHVIDVHGCRKIYMLAGEEESLASRMRVAGFRRALKSHRIECDESNIMFGEFWYSFGERIAGKIASGELEKPDAVIAASDYIALGFVNEAVKLGIKIPDDIVVTGFDGVIESRANEISLTSYLPSIAETGEKAAVRLAEIIEKRKMPIVTNFTGKLVCGMSCGCMVTNTGKRERDDFGYIAPSDKETDMTKFLHSYMTETLTASSNMNELMNQILRHAYLVDNCLEYYLCTCEEWMNAGDDLQGMDIGYTDRMKISVYRCVPELFSEWEDKERKPDPYLNTWFDSSEMLPKIYESTRDVPAVFYFTPVHFNGRRIGYSVMRFSPDNAVINFIYQQWSRNVNSALEMMRVRELLYAKSTRDTMTGLYNRNSLEGHINKVFDMSVANSSEMYVTFVDMNSLKYINDVYGHDAGDSAICTLAGIISYACMDGSVCIRMGGDEFLIIGQSSDAQKEISDKTQSIIKRLEAYNASSGKPYMVTASFGSCSRRISSAEEADALIREADVKMYEYKVNFKKNNKTDREG